MKALLLAAGEGTRLRPLTADQPKAMVMVAGRPLISYLLAWLRAGGVSDVAINLHHHSDALTEYVKDGSVFGLSVRYSREPVLLGSAGALGPLRSFFAGTDPFVVLYGDVLTDLDLAAQVELHRARGSHLTLAVTTAEDPTRCGVVGIGSGDRVTRFQEKPSRSDVFSSWVNAGVYVCSPTVLEDLPRPCPVPYDFGGGLIPRMLEAGRHLAAFRTEGTVLDVGSLERLATAANMVRAGWLERFAGAARC